MKEFLSLPFCIDCGHEFEDDEMIFYKLPKPSWLHSHDVGYICQKCSERENMVQTKTLKITAEVDGKQVPLETVSTETFEAIKALEKPKEIPVPVARVGNWPGELKNKRLFLKITDSIRGVITRHNNVEMIAIDLKDGYVTNSWKEPQQIPSFFDGDPYKNIKSL